MDNLKNLKEEILKDYPRLNLEDEFSFSCHPGVPCFNKCCSDVNIFLTPYDILRLKNALGITSEEFLTKYTIMPAHEKQDYPIMQLKMNDTEDKNCPFVTEKGCSVYNDRPWPCRMYPVGAASPKDTEKEEAFYFIMKEKVCQGFEEKKDWVVKDWLKDQDIAKYDEMGELFKDITINDYFAHGGILTPNQLQMFFLGCYNLDDFKKFVFDSSFFDRIDVDAETREKIENDDEELLKFAFNWLKFALFAKKTVKIKQSLRPEK